MEYHPWYSAYAFRWTTLNKKNSWSNDVIDRLTQHKVIKGDDVFKVIYAIGPFEAMIWDNDFEILLYASGKALIMDHGNLMEVKDCEGCANIKFSKSFSNTGYSDEDVLEKLKLVRPKY